MTPVLISHPEKNWKERERKRKTERKRKKERNNTLLSSTCIFNLIFEIVHILRSEQENDKKKKKKTWNHNEVSILSEQNSKF